MKWEKIEYPWKGINIPNSEIDLRMKLFDDFVTYFGFDRMALITITLLHSIHLKICSRMGMKTLKALIKTFRWRRRTAE